MYLLVLEYGGPRRVRDPFALEQDLDEISVCPHALSAVSHHLAAGHDPRPLRSSSIIDTGLKVHRTILGPRSATIQ